MIFNVHIGYDARENVAYDVCRHSLLRHATIPLHVGKLALPSLQAMGLYKRTWHTEERQRIDDIDGLPFSTDFSFSRFLVPALEEHTGWALVCDSDFLFLADIAELVAQADETKAVMVCKQAHMPAGTVKMDGQAQSRYMRKNWSSLMLLNCGHEATRRLTVDAVNTQSGRWLHGFAWCPDDCIGALDPAWNWIDGVTSAAPKAVHYSEGGPWFAGYEDVAFAREWTREYQLSKHLAIVERGLPDPRRFAA